MGSLVQIQSPRPIFAPMPVLLLTNDDGVHASGLQALAEALAELGEAHVPARERPVLVAASVNHGSNLGDDVTYSGTVSAAMEGTLLGVPSIAVSLAEGGDFAGAARVAREVCARGLLE